MPGGFRSNTTMPADCTPHFSQFRHLRKSVCGCPLSGVRTRSPGVLQRLGSPPCGAVWETSRHAGCDLLLQVTQVGCLERAAASLQRREPRLISHGEILPTHIYLVVSFAASGPAAGWEQAFSSRLERSSSTLGQKLDPHHCRSRMPGAASTTNGIGRKTATGYGLYQDRPFQEQDRKAGAGARRYVDSMVLCRRSERRGGQHGAHVIGPYRRWLAEPPPRRPSAEWRTRGGP